MDTNKKMVAREDLLLRDEVYAIIGAAMEVHNELGAGFLEAAYQEAMEIELSMRSLPFQPQRELHIRYKGRDLEKNVLRRLRLLRADHRGNQNDARTDRAGRGTAP